jgi:hypothetical protein
LGFGTLKNTGPDQENNVFTKIKIKSEKTMLTAAQFDALCSGGDVKTYVNPWLGGDPADDKNDYYIHICYPYTYNTITPLPGLTAGTIAETKTLNSKALAYITKAISCPADQVLQSMTGGSATCVARDNNYSCASGQTLEKIVDGNPVCVAKDGEYTCASGQVLKEVKNGAAVCVDRDASYGCGEGQVLKNVNNGSPTCVDMDKAYNCGENYVLQATSTGGAVCVDKDRGVTGCPWGQFAYGISYGMPLCAQVYNAAPSYGVFGGVFTNNLSGHCLRPNPRTGGCSCPSGTGAYMISEFTGDMPGEGDGDYCTGYSNGGRCGYESWACL